MTALLAGAHLHFERSVRTFEISAHRGEAHVSLLFSNLHPILRNSDYDTMLSIVGRRLVEEERVG